MKVNAKLTFCFLICVFFVCVAAKRQAPEVHTELGSLRGPSLRLAPPQPVEGWKGVRDATKQPPMCIQNKQNTLDLFSFTGAILEDLPDISEDCLYLNIYTPANRAKDAKLPVMVWIHGGGITMGSASMYDGSALAAYQDVVVVLIQYRLGLLGFLSTGDEHMSGNFGMLDQIEALMWIQEHIDNFGGDPDSVTIFGESAGAVIVSVLLLSPMSSGLIHHVIAESGTAAMDFLVRNDHLPAMEMVANASGCSTKSTEMFGDCVRNLDVATIAAIAENKNMVFWINVDGHFLMNPVHEQFRKQEIHPLPYMTGVNTHEGGFAIPNYINLHDWTEGVDREDFMNVLSFYHPESKEPFKRDLITNEYIGTGENRVKNRDGLTEMIGDVLFTIPVNKAAVAHRDAGADVYLYEFQHPPKILQDKRPSFVGCDHTDEIFLVLGFCFTTTHSKFVDSCSEEEEQLSRTMMSYWGNFARTGSPNGDGLAHWPKYGEEEEYLAIGLKEQVVGRGLKKDRFVFMTETLPEKIRQHNEKTEHSEL